MRISYLFCKLIVAGMFIFLLQACKKENGIDNETVIKKPYGLFIGDEQGQLLNTTDGDYYKTLFPPDGYPSRALTTSGNNILWIKNNAHLSEDNGKNFNPTYMSVQQAIPRITPLTPWSQVMLDVPGHERVYIASMLGKGIAYSENNGSTWITDMAWAEDVDGGLITSFAQLENGRLFAHSTHNDSLYVRNDRNALWEWVEQISPLPSSAYFYITHFNNTLIATDIYGFEGVWGSNDEGSTWQRYSGLPPRILYATHAPFNQTLLVGTDSLGVYRLEGNTFVSASYGLETGASIYAIRGKNNVYKNDVNKEYVYLATSKGLYRSDDLGRNWYLIKPGVYVALY